MTENKINNLVKLAGIVGLFSESPTTNLRFVIRNEKRILQQQYRVNHTERGTFFRWKDIPLEEE